MISGIFIPLIFLSIGPSKKKVAIQESSQRWHPAPTISSDFDLGIFDTRISFAFQLFQRNGPTFLGGKTLRNGCLFNSLNQRKPQSRWWKKFRGSEPTVSCFRVFFGEKNVKFLFEKKNWQIPELRVVAFDFFIKEIAFGHDL